MSSLYAQESRGLARDFYSMTVPSGSQLNQTRLQPIRSLDKCKGCPAIVSGPRTATETKRQQASSRPGQTGLHPFTPTRVFYPQSRGLVLLFRDREP